MDPSGQSTDATPGSLPPEPTPTIGSYPDFPHENYDFTVSVTCFCPDAGNPIRIRVRDGEVTDATFAGKGRGHGAGDPVVGSWQRLTLDQIIAAANNTEADKVQVDWPAGQDYPSSVYVDQSFQAVDEEIGYTVSDVVVDPA